MKLISMGQKDIDYKEKADGTIVMDRRSWMGGIQFAMPGEKSQNPSTSPTAYDQAQQNARQFGGTYSNRDGIPDMAWQYRLRGSRLDTAGLKKDEYEKKVTESELQVLKGAKTMEAHEDTLQECAPLMKEYLSLVQDLREGKYDIWQDVQTIS